MTSFDYCPEFKKDLKKLEKHFRTLSEDVSVLESVIKKGALNFDGLNATILQKHDAVTVVKARLFCRSLRKNTLRIIFIQDTVKQTVLFIELYFKGDKPNEDLARLKRYI